MNPVIEAPSRAVRRILLDGGDVTLSALVSEPERTPPRATVVALHGAGMSAGYFHGVAHPDLSLLRLGADLGFTVLAVDRPGYGASTASLPEGRTLAEQATTARAALRDFQTRHPTGAGLFLLGHSFGGKLALTVAADDPPADLLGVDVSGCGHRYAVPPEALAGAFDQRNWRLHWGQLGLYPPTTFQSTAALIASTPIRERWAAGHWPTLFADIAARIRVPVRFTFAEHESWWRHDPDALADLTGLLAGVPRLQVDRQPRAGHNISLGWAARSYHLRALGFLEECLPR